jgi:mono/diheme cytochrome c family protein
MPTSPTFIRLLSMLVAGTTLLVASGCGTSNADPARGRSLFIQRCGTCHQLAQAATAGVQGPDLDAAFAAGRAAGQDSDTIEGVVKAQVEFPRPAGNINNPNVVMPRNLVQGQDLEDVASYVASVAGVPGAAPPKVPGGPGAQVFANNGCSACHTLKAANAGGAVGPNLDEVLPGQTAAMITESIVSPDTKIEKGFPANVMPGNYEKQIPSDQLKQLVSYLAQSAGK